MTLTTGAVSDPSRSTPSIRSAFLSPDDQRWGAALPRLRHDVYQLPEYVAFASRQQVPGTPIAYLAEAGERRLLIPLIVRPMAWAQGDAPVCMDATSPRGFPGPVSGPDEAPDLDAFTDAALADFVMALRDQAIISAFIRLHPFVGPSSEVLARYGALVDIGHSFCIDLGRTDDDLWMQMRENHRRDIARARKAGYRVRVDDDWQHFDGFVRAFQESMVRLGAEPHWLLSRTYFTELREALADRVHLCVVEIDGELAAASLVTEADGVAEYHLAGTFDAHVRASPSKLIIRFLGGWARARGNRVLHLAGSVAPGDSLSHFKAGFSSMRLPMRSWRVIADPAAYASLVRDWETHARRRADTGASYFPAYRKPLGGEPDDADA